MFKDSLFTIHLKTVYSKYIICVEVKDGSKGLKKNSFCPQVIQSARVIYLHLTTLGDDEISRFKDLWQVI